MAKRPEPQDDAEVVRQMDLLKDVDPSDVSMPKSAPEDKQKADLEAILARAAQRKAEDRAAEEARDKRMYELAENLGKGESVDEMLARNRERRRAIQKSVAEQAQRDAEASAERNPLFGGGIGGFFKDLGGGLGLFINEIVVDPAKKIAAGLTRERPEGTKTVFDLPSMTEEEREGSIMAPRASDDLKPQAEVEVPPARTSQERAPTTSGRQPISPQTFPDTRLPRTGFQRPPQPQPQQPTPQPTPQQQQQQPPPPETIARMAEEAVERTGESIFTPEQAPELFRAVPAAGGQDGSQKIIELLETLPRRISEELKS